MAQPLILLLEDDPAIARSIIFTLERDGLRVTHCVLVADAHRQLAVQTPSLLILDIGLPDGNGLDVCKAVRSAGATCQLPVLMLSAHGEEIDRVLGLELGADDYVSKPFSPRELLARVRSLLRRSGMQAPLQGAASKRGPFEVDELGRRIKLDGHLLNLTRLEHGLLADLLAHRGRIRSRDDLLTAVWGDDAGPDRTVDTHIKTLRAKLQAAQTSPISPTSPTTPTLQSMGAPRDFIITHRGMGYALVD
ncbi:MAG: response regulator [Chitinophagaceae bacterium]|nr:response regulator [Polaromonas sp.]